MHRANLVCVIDDDAFLRLRISAALLALNIPTIQGANGETGLMALRRAGGAVAVAIIDILMPDKEGFETIAEAKALYPDLKIIAICDDGLGQSATELLSIAREFGADAGLRKPFKVSELVDQVQALLHSRGETPALVND